MPEFELSEPTPTGPFDYSWPDAVEHFDPGWEGHATAGGRVIRVRYGLGVRIAYGRPRVRGVVWVNGEPVAEGVEADDYPTSRALISGIRKADKAYARSTEEVPEGIGRFPVVSHRSEIEAPYSRRILAVKLAEEDVLSWMAFGLARAEVMGRLVPAGTVTAPRRAPIQSPVVPAFEPVDVDKQAIVRRLLEVGESQFAPHEERVPAFTPDPEANALVIRDPFAFLLAVIFDQGIPYGRAWVAPLELKRRLGHLDPGRMAEQPGAVQAAIQAKPALHRYVVNMPAYVALAARKVIDEYGGDASRIWAGEPTARELQQRFDAFKGIGQKKAAMAVEMLERDLHVPIREMEGSDIAFDVHVRRVFLRTGLADRDDQDHMVEVARSLHPERPGELDIPGWWVGHEWCHPGVPDCPACPLTKVCPKLVDRAGSVW
jgi:uncharacterized HhH-GPD family protein